MNRIQNGKFSDWKRLALVVPCVGAVALGCLAGFVCQAQDLTVKSGEKIAFLGDSITQLGASSPSGYVHLVISGLEANGIKSEAIPAGISGHKSDNMLERLERDVLNKKPNLMALSCGVNDVWHGERGIPLEKYKENIRAIVERAQAANIKVVILTSTMITENPDNPNNKKLGSYNEFLRELAKEKKCPLADLNADMQAALKKAEANPPRLPVGQWFTCDGVHMNVIGNQMMAVGVLKALGLNEAQIAKAKEHWLDIPQSCEMSGKAKVSIRQFNQLNELAAKRNITVNDLLNKEFVKAVESLLNSGHK